MNLNNIHNVYFIGIGGIGMSAIAIYFKSNGKNVAGYDKTPTEITITLQKMGINIHFEDTVNLIEDTFKDTKNTIVIYTPAVPKNHTELNYFISNNYTVFKRSEILGEITKNTICLAVAGTHGKTTTSTILGHILKEANVNATSFLGGISENYNSNIILGGTEVSVVEADEFDRSFLKLSPNIACITSMDADHLDIYGAHSELEKSFQKFANKVSDTLIVRKGLSVQGQTYGIEEEADYNAYNIRIENGAYIFNIKTPRETFENIKIYIPGKHNVLNAVAALAMANSFGISIQVIAKALLTFKGIKRRFSYKINTENLVLIDDYAHHPTEINAVVDSVKEMYPEQNVLGVFQPHLYSRTRDFATDFAHSLSRFDELILLDIYPARELPIEGVNSKWLLDKISCKNKQLSSKENLIDNIVKSNAQIIVVIGAGDIGEEVENIKKSLIVEN
ncbi:MULTISPECIES: UDP-N-acetylmuramate--L-alanine ligase [Flavobacteriaceae]|uniref:UDP-N-acetylmuramate--L-alanine ligase n=2 Tax=Flavobacteriaceae TaxID=49546 RepID=A0A4Y8AT17_9FLAO|nr:MULTISPECIES: UDP-N-acetylmuramate--L-alanine ligase [Flavobacteriaceae]TEW75017.1 UDP-N-acetylmuramate--L-alanine ligase [Gramella jeungdoensis]GGK42259.1 UDP-N-acetylmuramate--L-alanine ligase [Lutibacter litoralis]